MRKLDHQNIVKLRFFFYSSGDKVSLVIVIHILNVVCRNINFVFSLIVSA